MANVANNKQRQFHDTITKKKRTTTNHAITALRPEERSKTQQGRLASDDSGTRHYTFPAVDSQTEEHRGDVPSRADALSGTKPFTLTGSGSAYRSEYGWNEAATDS